MKAAVLHKHETALSNPDFAPWEEVLAPEFKKDLHVIEMAVEIGQRLTPETKRKILDENAARLYQIEIAEKKLEPG